MRGRLMDGTVQFGFALPLIKGGRLQSISTRLHAAPTATMVLADVIEEKNAFRISAFFQECEIRVAKKVAHGLSDGSKQLGHICYA